MEASVFKMTHEQSLQQNGYTVCSPISGSMKPLIRPNVDSAVFVPPEKIRKYDVVLYRREGLQGWLWLLAKDLWHTVQVLGDRRGQRGKRIAIIWKGFAAGVRFHPPVSYLP